MFLSESQLGTLPLEPSITANVKNIEAHFPSLQVALRKGQQDGPNFTYYSLQKEKEIIRLVMGVKPKQKAQELSTVVIETPDISDQYGVRKGMTFTQAKHIRPRLQLITNSHFHTYAFDDTSNIKYEICCNTNQPDKTNWSEKEVSNWKITAIIWEAV